MAMTNKRKKTTAIVAGVTALALLLGGTFAWVSISQQAKNEAAGIVNVGGRLHDDFDGTNKDIYVENFTDPYNGGQPIYARVKLTEYMEVGKDAGGIDVDDDGNIDAVPVVADTKRDDVTTWTVHVPSAGCEVCATEGTCVIHDHWKWEMGGKTTFMPTFNKDKDSLEADVNGTYAGTNKDDKIYYDDYVVYTTVGNDGVNNNIAFSDKEAYEGEIYSVTGTAYYDNDPNMDPNDYGIEAELGGYRAETETHTAKETVNATVITMAEWIDGGKAPGNYWVYDTDGWAYWANPIMPGEATGLLLSGIEMFQNPGEKCYYAINVVGQFATVNDWEKFGVDEEDPDYPSEDALEVLDKASQNVPTVTVVNVDGKTLVKRGESVNFSASTSVGTASTLADSDEYEWVVLGEDFKESKTSSVEDNGDGTATLTVGTGEFSPSLYVAARSKTYGAVGTSAVAVQLYTVTVTGDTTANANKTKQFNATVTADNTGEAETSGVTWSLFGGNGASTIDAETGILTVDTTEADGAELTVKATSVNGGFTDTHTVTVVNKYAVTVSADSNYIDRGKTLQFTAEVTQNGETVTPDVTWTVTGGSATTNIDEDGLLTVDAYEKEAEPLTVTAISKADGTASGTYTVTVNKYEVSVTAGGATTVEAGKTLKFEAGVTKNGESDTSGVDWAVSSRSRMTTITPDGLLMVDTSVGNNTPLTVTATSKADKNISATYTVTVTAEYELKITSDATSVAPGESLQYNATLLVNGIEDGSYSPITWSVTDSQGNAVSNASIDENGILTVSETEYGVSELYVHAEHDYTETTSLAVADVSYTLTLETTGTFAPEGLRVDVAEPYYSAGDITAAFSNNTGNTRYEYSVSEDSDGVYLMLTHDDIYYEYADHGTRALTVTATGGETDSVDFACNSHANTAYTPEAYTWANDSSKVTIFEHPGKTSVNFQMKLMNGNTQVDEEYVKWDVTANSKASSTTMNSDGLLRLASAEYSPFVTIYYRTENAWGKKDIRVRYAETEYVMDEVKGLSLHLLSREHADNGTMTSNQLYGGPDIKVTHMYNASSDLGNGGWTFEFRLYDSNGNIIEEPLNLSIWVGDTNITNSGGGGYTNGYNSNTSKYGDGHGYYWIWSSRGNTTPVTFWISYVNEFGEVGTFEATIW